jgi:hypothetical protein
LLPFSLSLLIHLYFCLHSFIPLPPPISHTLSLYLCLCLSLSLIYLNLISHYQPVCCFLSLPDVIWTWSWFAVIPAQPQGSPPPSTTLVSHFPAFLVLKEECGLWGFPKC